VNITTKEIETFRGIDQLEEKFPFDFYGISYPASVQYDHWRERQSTCCHTKEKVNL